jgi:hypothetical protein
MLLLRLSWAIITALASKVGHARAECFLIRHRGPVVGSYPGTVIIVVDRINLDTQS